MCRLRFPSFLFIGVFAAGCASSPARPDRNPSSDESKIRKAECSVYRDARKIIEAKNIKVTNSNGGLRQGCKYTAADGKTTLFPIMADGQGGLLVALEYDKKQIVLSHDRTGEENSFSHRYWTWSVDSSIPHAGGNLRVNCDMYLSDRNSIAEDRSCPDDSDNN